MLKGLRMLVLYQGITVGYRYPLVDGDGLPANVAGWSAKCQIRAAEDHLSTMLFEPTCYIDNESVVVIEYTAEQSLDWDWDKGYFDVVLIDPFDVPRQILDSGKVRVDRIVTNAV